MESSETKGQARLSFASLLKNIVDVNEKRVAAMKKLNNLKDFIMTKNSLTKIHEYDMNVDSTEDDNNQHAILTLMDVQSHLNVTMRRHTNKNSNNKMTLLIPFNRFNIKSENMQEENNRIENKHDANDRVDNRNNEYDNIEDRNGYRKNWRGSCDKKAAKVCRSACVTAHKNGCKIFKCSRHAKKAFSKECKRSCRDKFLIGKYSDSDWEVE